VKYSTVLLYNMGSTPITQNNTASAFGALPLIVMARELHALRHVDFKLMIMTPLTFRYAVHDGCEDMITPMDVDYLSEINPDCWPVAADLLFPGCAQFDSNKAMLDFYAHCTVDALKQEAFVLEDVIITLRNKHRDIRRDNTNFCSKIETREEYNMIMTNLWYEILWHMGAYNCVIFIISFMPLNTDAEPFAGTEYIDTQMQRMRRTHKLVVA